jgi:hypothetical protein
MSHFIPVIKLQISQKGAFQHWRSFKRERKSRRCIDGYHFSDFLRKGEGGALASPQNPLQREEKDVGGGGEEGWL